MKIPKHLLHAELAPAKTESNARVASLKWYTGSTVRRLSWDGEYYLTLSMKSQHARMDRLKSGKAPLLDSHNDRTLSSVIGVVESADLKGDARIRFSNRSDVTPIWNDVKDGIIRNASVGINIYKLQDVSKKDKAGNVLSKEFLAIDWEPTEVSLVPIGADPNAGFRFSGEEDFTDVAVMTQASNDAGLAEIEIEREKLQLLGL